MICPKCKWDSLSPGTMSVVRGQSKTWISNDTLQNTCHLHETHPVVPVIYCTWQTWCLLREVNMVTLLFHGWHSLYWNYYQHCGSLGETDTYSASFAHYSCLHHKWHETQYPMYPLIITFRFKVRYCSFQWCIIYCCGVQSYHTLLFQ